MVKSPAAKRAYIAKLAGHAPPKASGKTHRPQPTPHSSKKPIKGPTHKALPVPKPKRTP